MAAAAAAALLDGETSASGDTNDLSATLVELVGVIWALFFLLPLARLPPGVVDEERCGVEGVTTTASGAITAGTKGAIGFDSPGRFGELEGGEKSAGAAGSVARAVI